MNNQHGERLKWGIIGTGSIAHAFAHGLSQSETGTLLGVGSRSKDSAVRFAAEFAGAAAAGASAPCAAAGAGAAAAGAAAAVPRPYGSYEELLADRDIQAVYVCVPHPWHAEWTIKAIEAGKHVLCEKPAALNHGQLMAMVEAAREKGVFFMEAFMYRCHPQTEKLVELIRSGAIGEVRLIHASFGFGGGDTINEKGRLFDPQLGGGGIMDVGCYPVSMSRLIAGAAMGRPYADPVKVSGGGKVGSTGVDEWAAGVLTFENGITAQVATAVRAGLDNVVEVYGSEGRITVPNPWVCNRKEADQGSITVKAKNASGVMEVTIHEIAAGRTTFAMEADRVARTIREGLTEAASPAMSWGDSLGNLAVLDQWREALGVAYPAETPEGNRPVRAPLAKRTDAPMMYGSIAGLDKKVSRLIFGCDNQTSYAHGAAIWDDWYERGGNAFDTSWVYGGGRMEILLGQWIKARGLRDEVVVTVKGAHTPRCLPDLLVEDFNTSLGRLQFDHADIYIMHRDNPAVPIGEFVDALNDLISRGLIRGAIGGSNWSMERFGEFNAYAAAKGKQGLAVLNNNLSLARMVKPVWKGCVHVSDRKTRRQLAQDRTTVFSWSSQARGYFLDETERMKLGAGNFECWDASDNRERRNRAEELARKKGCSPINIAAAYVLNQPYPTFALVGPRTIHETATTLPALPLRLTQEEIDWLWGSDI